MSVIKSAPGTPVGALGIKGSDAVVDITLDQQSGSLVARGDLVVSRADFLAAVRDLGVIVIDEADLPVLSPGDLAYWRKERTPASEHRRIALYRLAAARDADANPPVDEAQVEALAEMIRVEVVEKYRADFSSAETASAARALLATGRIEVKP